MAELGLSSMGRLIKKSGAKRVSEDGKQKMREVLEKYAQELSSKATSLAEHAGRKTVKSRDIALALAA